MNARPAPSPPTGRTIVVREGVGVTAEIIQRRELLFTGIVIAQPTLITVRRGKKTLRWSGGECLLRMGEAVAVAGGLTLDIENHPGPDGWYEAQWLSWAPSVIAGFPESDPAVPVVRSVMSIRRHAPAFREDVARAIDAIRDRAGVPDAVAKHRVSEVLVWIGLHGGRFETPRPSSASARVRSLLSAAPARPWTAPVVARELAMSEGTLRRRLSSEGVSFTTLLIDVRMARALALLQATDRPVTQIAQDVGYDSPSRFAVRFRNRFGHPPTALRMPAAG